MEQLPQNDPDYSHDPTPHKRTCSRLVLGGMCICVGCVLAVLTVWSALGEGGKPDNVLHGFVCTGCAGECPGGAACDKCTCVMAPQGCDEGDPNSPCWDTVYTQPLVPVEAPRALCGVSVAGCGLPRD